MKLCQAQAQLKVFCNLDATQMQSRDNLDAIYMQLSWNLYATYIQLRCNFDALEGRAQARKYIWELAKIDNLQW